jgi:2-C-methyl-D-erythritol 4-phosphate cytidylyltransferase
MVSVADITKCIEAAKQYGGAALAREVTETIKRSDNDGFTRGGVDRKGLWFMETPQCFRANLLKRAYINIKDRRMTVTDDVSALESIGVSTKIIASSHPNLKITVPGDIPIVAQMMCE